ncbi:MAG: hypothetical protein AAF708_20195 [Deinococcota bacterium]
MWLDALFLLVMIAVTALASQRNLTGLVVGLGSLIVYKPLMLLAGRNLGASLIAGLVLAAGLGFGGRIVARFVKLRPLTGSLLGAVGGIVMSLLLVLSFSISLPLRRDINNNVVYPPDTWPQTLETTMARSRVIQLGRNVLLYPLFRPDEFSSAERPILNLMHRYLVTGEPWTQTP